MTALRVWLTKVFMPRGYALWTYGQYGDDSSDGMLIYKEARRDG